MTQDSDFIKSLKSSKLRIPSGSGSDGISETFRALIGAISPDLARMLSQHVGSISVEQGTGDHFISSITVAPDVWYIVHADSVLPIDDQETTDTIMEALGDFLEDLGGVSPLKTVRGAYDIGYTSSTWDTKAYNSNNGPYMIKEMRYESRRPDQGLRYGGDRNSAGYPVCLSFPVGPMGVMEILSLVRSSEEYSTNSQSAPITTWDALISPKQAEFDFCLGDHLVTKGYLLAEEVEYPSIEFDDKVSALPHKWLKFWLADSDTKPYPGEFVGLLARPYPYHAWWFQESSPFLYSGNWYETEFYTSGIVLAVYEPTGAEVANSYLVQIKAEQVTITSTDLKEYAVDDRVTVLKKTGLMTAAFNWDDLGNMADVIVNIDWYIIPITFYE